MKKHILITVMLVLMLLAAACAPKTPVSVDGNASFTSEVTQTPTAPIHDSTPSPTPAAVVTATPVITPTPTVKPTPTPTPQPVKTYKQAYAEVVRGAKNEYKDDEDEKLVFGLIDADGDEIPELTVHTPYRGTKVYTFFNGQAVCVIEDNSSGAGGNRGYSYIPGENVFCNYFWDNSQQTGHGTYYSIQEGKAVYTHSLSIEYGIDSNEDWFVDESEQLDEPNYYMGDRKLTKEEAEQYWATGNFQSLLGEMSEEQILKELE